MTQFHRSLRAFVLLAVFACLTLLIVAPASAGLAPSRVSGETSIVSARSADMIMAQRVLENKVVARKLGDYGLTPEQVQSRLATMSDQDLHTLASASRGLPSGGDGTSGALIGVLVVVILFIVILRLTHHDVVVR